jgi:hypothetical protein
MVAEEGESASNFNGRIFSVVFPGTEIWTMATATVKRSAKKLIVRKPIRTKAGEKRAAKKDLAASYNEYKEFEGHQYTGMQVGRSHTWHYDKGEWKETKITPDLWELSYAVTKRRKGRAPEGSGVPVGTGYHWYIMAHQNVTKLNANDYTTSMTGLKYKLAHKRASKDTWSTTTKTQRKHLVEFLKQMITELEQEPIQLQFDHKGQKMKGEALPLTSSCDEGVCNEYDVHLNDDYLGVIHNSKGGWKMKYVKDQKLVDAIGQEIQAHSK